MVNSHAHNKAQRAVLCAYMSAIFIRLGPRDIVFFWVSREKVLEPLDHGTETMSGSSLFTYCSIINRWLVRLYLKKSRLS